MEYLRHFRWGSQALINFLKLNVSSVAYKVLDFQMSGSDLYSSSTISFNNLCSYYGLQENPFKDIFKNILWKMNLTKDGAFGLDNPEPMLDELIVYCAWDVEPLIR